MNALTVTKENFDQEILAADKPVLIDFWAPWCAPCRMLTPVIEEIAGDAAVNARVGKINIDEQPELADRFGIMSIPTLVVIKAGKVTATVVGVQPKAAILSMLEV